MSVQSEAVQCACDLVAPVHGASDRGDMCHRRIAQCSVSHTHCGKVTVREASNSIRWTSVGQRPLTHTRHDTASHQCEQALYHVSPSTWCSHIAEWHPAHPRSSRCVSSYSQLNRSHSSLVAVVLVSHLAFCSHFSSSVISSLLPRHGRLARSPPHPNVVPRVGDGVG